MANQVKYIYMKQIYVLDKNNFIIEAHNVEGNIVGKNYFDFAYDKVLIDILKNIFDKVRIKKKVFSTTYRCDDYRFIRRFRLDIIPLNDDNIKLEHTLLEKKDRVKPIDELGKSNKIFTMCAWCNKILCGNEYLEIDYAINELGLFETEGIPNFSHGICPECKAKLEEEISQYAKINS